MKCFDEAWEPRPLQICVMAKTLERAWESMFELCSSDPVGIRKARKNVYDSSIDLNDGTFFKAMSYTNQYREYSFDQVILNDDILPNDMFEQVICLIRNSCVPCAFRLQRVGDIGNGAHNMLPYQD